jgi:hypothetical protein
LGAYALCSQRAAFDRGVSEGMLDPKIRSDHFSPYAALGTVEHFHLQDGLRCTFPSRDKAWIARHQGEIRQIAIDYFGGDMGATVSAFAHGDPLAFAPTKAEIASAQSLFDSNDTMMGIVRDTVRAAADQMPKLADGATWLAEPFVDTSKDLAPGHIDFLASDNSWIVDLKTTSRKPAGGKVKTEAFWQMCDYHLNTLAPKGRVLYVDSKGGEWTLSVDIDFTSEIVQDFLPNIPKLVKSLRSKHLYETAFPQLLNQQCSDSFCPYVSICRDALIPRGNDKGVGGHVPSGEVSLG